MFKLNVDQFEELRADRLAAFLDEMETWVMSHYQPRPDALPEGAIRDEVLRARELGFVLRGHAKRWLRLGLTFQIPFAEVPWAKATAKDETLAPAGRLHVLERRGALYLPREPENLHYAA